MARMEARTLWNNENLYGLHTAIGYWVAALNARIKD
jgi:hypothetical protein